MSKKTTLVLLVAGVIITMAQPAMALPPPGQHVPDGGSSALLLAVACVGIAAARRFIGKGK